jgi:hypothetical protein
MDKSEVENSAVKPRREQNWQERLPHCDFSEADLYAVKMINAELTSD